MFKFFSELKNPRTWLYIIGPFFLLILIYSIFGFGLSHPVNFPDELGFWGHARYLAGGNHISFFARPYVSFGYSLFLVPAFWIFEETALIHQTVLAINIVWMASLYFCLYYLLRQVFSLAPKPAMAIALTASLYPAFFYFTNFVMAESIFVPGYALLLVFFWRLLKYKSISSALAFVILANFLYAVHPRAWLLPWLALLFIVGLFFYKFITKKVFFISLVAAILIMFIIKYANSILMDIGWQNVVAYSVYDVVLSKLGTIEGIKTLFLTALGQFLYLIQSTFGLFILSFIYVVKKIIRPVFSLKNIFNDKERLWYLWLLLSALVIFMTSCGVSFLAMDIEALRGDHFLYGRYNEGFLAVFLMIGILSFYFKEKSHKLSVAIIFVLISLIFNWGYNNYDFLASFSQSNTIGILAFSNLLGQVNILLVSILSLFFFFVVHLLFRKNFYLGLLFIAIFFSYSIIDSTKLLRQFNEGVFKLDRGLIEPLSNLQGVEYIAYDMSYTGRDSAHWKSWYFNSYYYQYYFPDIKFKPFYSVNKQEPSADYIISSIDWPDAERLGAKIVAQDESSGQVLWYIEL